LRQLKHKEIVLNTLGSISENEALSLVGQHNTITVVDGSLGDHYPSFIDKLVTGLDHFSMLVLVVNG
jgi:hypothetical protein